MSGVSQRTANRFHRLQNGIGGTGFGQKEDEQNAKRATHKRRRSRTIEDGQLFGCKREPRNDQRPKWDKQKNDDWKSDRS